MRSMCFMHVKESLSDIALIATVCLVPKVIDWTHGCF